MKNPVLFYGVIVLGIIALAAGVYMLTANFHGKAYAVIAVGAVLLIAGVVGTFMSRAPKVATK